MVELDSIPSLEVIDGLEWSPSFDNLARCVWDRKLIKTRVCNYGNWTMSAKYGAS